MQKERQNDATAPHRRTAGTTGSLTRSRHILRRLLRNWRYSAAIVVILGIGIGPAAVGLSVVNNVLLRPLDYSEPERLGVVRIDIGELKNHPGLHQGEILDLREQETEIFQGIEHAIFGQISLGEGEELVAVSMSHVSAGLFETLGVLHRAGPHLCTGGR